MNRRLRREAETIEKMIGIYCRDHHNPGTGLCPVCEDLKEYARQRLEKCPYNGSKPTCARCPVHCYEPRRRERVRDIMRYAGPRMLARHPYLAVMHLADKLHKVPERKKGGISDLEA